MSLKCSGKEKHLKKVVRNLNGARGCPAKDGHPLLCFHTRKDTLGHLSYQSPQTTPLGLAQAMGSWGFLAHRSRWASPVAGCAERQEAVFAAKPANTSQPIKLSKGNH